MHRWIARCCLLLGLMGGLVGGAGEARAQVDAALVARQQAVGQASVRLTTLERELSELGARHRALVQRIDQLKRAGTQGFAARRELEGLQREARELAETMHQRQVALREARGQVDAERQRLFAHVDLEIRKWLEAMALAPAAHRPAILSRVQQLRAIRQRHEPPMPTAPRAGAMAATAPEFSDSPELLMATADELEDNSDQIARRLSAIETRLTELRQARQLRRRARSFSRQERFFEPTERRRVIARYDRSAASGAGAERSASGGDANRTTASAGAGAAESADQADLASSNNLSAPAGASADAESGASAGMSPPAAEGDAPTLAPSPSAPMAEPESAPSTTASAPTERVTVLRESNLDPARSVGGQGSENWSLDQNIEQLEAERRALEKQARELRERATRLRQKARTILD